METISSTFRTASPAETTSSATSTPSAPTQKATEGAVEGPGTGKSFDLIGPKVDSMPLDVYEKENGKLLPSVFDVKNLAHTFPLKAELGAINNYIRSEIEARKMESNKENFEKILSEIEEQIGTKEVERLKRINRIFNYVKVLNKYNQIKEKKNSYIIKND